MAENGLIKWVWTWVKRILLILIGFSAGLYVITLASMYLFGSSESEAVQLIKDIVQWVNGVSSVILLFAVTFLVLRILGGQILRAPREALDVKNHKSWRLLRRWSWPAIAQSALVGASVMAFLLVSVSTVPILGTSLYRIIIAIIRYDTLAPAPDEATEQLSPVARAIAMCLSVLLALSILPRLPRAALMEELIFRKGTKTWWQAVKRCTVFGLVHPLFLPIIPIFLALPLGLVGFWFTLHYWRGGVRRSTLYHGLYNLCVVPMIIIVTFIFW